MPASILAGSDLNAVTRKYMAHLSVENPRLSGTHRPADKVYDLTAALSLDARPAAADRRRGDIPVCARGARRRFGERRERIGRFFEVVRHQRRPYREPSPRPGQRMGAAGLYDAHRFRRYRPL